MFVCVCINRSMFAELRLMVKQTLSCVCPMGGRRGLGQMEKPSAHPFRDVQSGQCHETLHMNLMDADVYG